MKQILKGTVVSLLTLSLMIIGVSYAHGSVVPLRNLGQLTNLAEWIFVGEVLSVTDNYVEGQIPYTEITFKISKSIKGDLQEGQTFSYRQAGLLAPRDAGNGLRIAFALDGFPQYQVGEEALVFLYKPSELSGLTSPVGLLQGKFTIANGSITNGVNNQNLFADMDVDQSRLSKTEANLLVKKQGPTNAKALIDLVSRAVKEGMFK